MCGVAAIWGKGDIRPMTRILAHRGPDAEGFYEKGAVKLGSRRLKVIDLVGGDQPMVSADGRTAIVYNGEVFNYRELRAELAAEYEFRTQCDTEVLLAAFGKWGPACLARLNGQFAFVIYDGERFFAARDRLGEKPLYWAKTADGFYAASEIKALLTQITSAPRIDEAFWVYDAAIAPETLFDGVYELPPAHALYFDGRTVRVERYWEAPPPVELPPRRDDDYVEELRALIEDSVRLRMTADVPVGLFLSGGLDSSIMAAVARPADVFTCRFELGRDFDEFHYAETIARAIGARQHVVTPTAEDFARDLETMIGRLDQPIATASTIAEFALARKASESVTVVLGGQGADEIFRGYVRYLLMHIEFAIAGRPELASYQPLARFFWCSNMFAEPAARYFHLIHRARPRDPEPYLAQLRPFFAGRGLLDALGLADLRLSLPSLLTMNDRAAAAFGLENRCPFLDHRIVEFAFRLPPHLKIRDVTQKAILRTAARPLIPAEIIDRRDKKGLVTPVHRWLNGPLKTWAADLERSFAERRLPRPAGNDRGEFDRGQYTRICLELWFRRFFPDWHA